MTRSSEAAASTASEGTSGVESDGRSGISLRSIRFYIQTDNIYAVVYIHVVDIQRMRNRHNISLSELAFVSGIPKPTIAAIEQGRFRLSAEKEVRLRRAVELIAEHKRRWRDLTKRIEQELKDLHLNAGGRRQRG